MHRDIKLQNVLIQKSDDFGATFDFDVKLTDFGFSIHYEEGVGQRLQLGSSHYMAPEILAGQRYTHKVDIWSVGILAYILKEQDFPFKGDKPHHVLSDMTRKGFTPVFKHRNWKDYPAWESFVKSCLRSRYQDRPEATDLMQHEWFEEEQKR